MPSRSRLKGGACHGNFPEGRLRFFFWVLAVILGLMLAFALRFSMNPDGICYLDSADAYWRGEWRLAISSYWSPLYSWLLAITLHVVRPSAFWEFPLVRALNFVLFLITLLTFEYFLGVCADDRLAQSEALRAAEGGDRPNPATPPIWAWHLLGYSLFLWVALDIIYVYVTPDMCVAAIVFLATALIIRIRQVPERRPLYAWLGLVLGIGYLAKTVMFPLGFIFIATAALAGGGLRRAWKRVLVALAVFVGVSAPLVLAMTVIHGRLTFGESGRLNYIWNVDRDDLLGPKGYLFPDTSLVHHSEARVFSNPPAYSIEHPAGVTFSLWYDPAFWNRDLTWYFNWSRQVRALSYTSGIYYYFLFRSQKVWFIGMVLLLLLSLGRSFPAGRTRIAVLLFIPALAGLGIYLPVFTEGRYTGSFMVLLWLGLLSTVRWPVGEKTRKLAVALVVIMAVSLLFPVVRRSVVTTVAMQEATPDDWEIAQGLQERGTAPGDKVAIVGSGIRAYWARLARVRIVAEVPPWGMSEFWAAKPETSSELFRALTATGAQAVIVPLPPPHLAGSRWERVGKTDFYVYPLAR